MFGANRKFSREGSSEKPCQHHEGRNRDALAALKECALRSPSLPPESTERAGSSGEKPQMTNTQSALSVTPKATCAKPVNGRTTRSAPAREPVDQMRLFSPGADFVMKLNSLEQQLAQSREDNKQLRRRMVGGDRRLRAEPDRNRQLLRMPERAEMKE